VVKRNSLNRILVFGFLVSTQLFTAGVGPQMRDGSWHALYL
jgi:hypothetical protein